MERKNILGIVILLILAFAGGIVFDGLVLTGQVVNVPEEESKNYTWTKAICKDNDSGTECIDVLVECEKGQVVGLEPASDVKEFGEDWEDPRGDFASVYCE
jgi:hypothetical protein